jgi:hypothetical protein
MIYSLGFKFFCNRFSFDVVIVIVKRFNKSSLQAVTGVQNR